MMKNQKIIGNQFNLGLYLLPFLKPSICDSDSHLGFCLSLGQGTLNNFVENFLNECLVGYWRPKRNIKISIWTTAGSGHCETDHYFSACLFFCFTVFFSMVFGVISGLLWEKLFEIHILQKKIFDVQYTVVNQSLRKLSAKLKKCIIKTITEYCMLKFKYKMLPKNSNQNFSTGISNVIFVTRVYLKWLKNVHIYCIYCTKCCNNILLYFRWLWLWQNELK